MLDVECHCTQARRTARALTAFYDAALASAGLKVTQFALLRAIARLDAPTISAAAEATGLDRSTLGRNLRLLEGAGFIALGPGRDERTRIVALTEEGGAAIARALPLWHAAQRRVANLTKAEDLAALARIGRSVADA